MNTIDTSYSVWGVLDSAIGGRPDNQDDCGTIDTQLGLLVVLCDGMGGGPGGRAASGILKNVFCKTVAEAESFSEPEVVLMDAAEKANASILQMTQAHPELIGMGSTLVGVLFHPNAAYVIHCGDSRLYQFRGHKTLFRTGDHSLVGAMVRAGSMTEEQARTSPQSNVLMRYMGNKNYENPDICAIPYKCNDRFVLCSDGVWGMFPEKELISLLTSKEPINIICQNIQSEIDIFGATNPESHHDNHTLIIIDVQMDSVMIDNVKRNPDIKKFFVLTCAALGLLSIGIFIFLLTSSWSNKTTKIEVVDSLSNKNQSGNNEPKVVNQATSGNPRPVLLDKNVNEQIRFVKTKKREKEIEDSIANVRRADSIRKTKLLDSQKKVNKSASSSKPNKKNANTNDKKTTTTAVKRIKSLLNGMKNAKSNDYQLTAKDLDQKRKDILKEIPKLQSYYPKEAKSIEGILLKEVNKNKKNYAIIQVSRSGRPTDNAIIEMNNALEIINSIPDIK